MGSEMCIRDRRYVGRQCGTGEERRSGCLTRWRRWQRRSRTGIARHDVQPSLCHWFSCSTTTDDSYPSLLPPPTSARTFTGKTISDAEFSEVRGQGWTKRRCLKTQELISGVGQAMTVGTFGPMEWGAVVGLIAHRGVNTVQRYLWLYERGTVPRSCQNGAQCVTKFMVT